MVKKVKRFIVFVLFSFFYSLLSGKISNENGPQVFGISKAEAKCCPAGSTMLDSRGNCCNGNVDKDGVCYN